MMKLIPTKTFYDPLNAQMAKGLLEQNEICCYLDVEQHSSLNWAMINGLGGITLFVEENDANQATELIMAFEFEFPETIKLKCPQCNSEDLKSINPNWFIKLIWVLISATPSFYSRLHRNCKNCGYSWKIDVEKE